LKPNGTGRPSKPRRNSGESSKGNERAGVVDVEVGAAAVVLKQEAAASGRPPREAEETGEAMVAAAQAEFGKAREERERDHRGEAEGESVDAGRRDSAAARLGVGARMTRARLLPRATRRARMRARMVRCGAKGR
jgi:hypothetical protein